MSKRDILVLAEGEATDYKLITRLLSTYGIYEEHQVVVYGTSAYLLYDALFRDSVGNEVLDIALHLREREDNPEKKALLSQRFSRILLIFDFDPQSTYYSQEKITELSKYFTDAADMGVLYINYPMIESYYHLKSIPDPDYNSYTTTLIELSKKRKAYKHRVHQESCISDRNTFFESKVNCSIVIRQNFEKAWNIVGGIQSTDMCPPNQEAILAKQLEMLCNDSRVSVLCTCVFYILDYNPALVMEH